MADIAPENSDKHPIIGEKIPIIPIIGEKIPKIGETIPIIGQKIPIIGETTEIQPKRRGRPSGVKDKVVRVKKPRVILEERVAPPLVEPEPIMPTQPLSAPVRPRSISPETRLRHAHNTIMNHRMSHHEARRNHWDGQILKSLRLR